NQQTLFDGNVLLEKAESSNANEKNKLLIQVAYIFIKNQSYNQSEEILSRVDTKNLNNDWKAFFYSQKAELLIYQQHPNQAIEVLDANIDTTKINIQGQVLVAEIKAKALFQDSQYIKSINELIFISP